MVDQVLLLSGANLPKVSNLEIVKMLELFRDFVVHVQRSWVWPFGIVEGYWWSCD